MAGCHRQLKRNGSLTVIWPRTRKTLYWCSWSLPKDCKLQFDVAADSKSIQDNDGFVLRCPLFISSYDVTPSDEWLKSNFQFTPLLFTNWQMRKLNLWEECVRDCWGYRKSELNNEPYWEEVILIFEYVIIRMAFVLLRCRSMCILLTI